MTENEIIAHARIALCYRYMMRGNVRAIRAYDRPYELWEWTIP
jgi:hypothetical protein